MQTFPVTDSTLSARHISIFIKEKYSVKGDVEAQLFRTGINHSYIITCESEKFVFRVYSYNWRTELEIQEEIRLLELLKSEEISISYPLKDAKGQYIQELPAPEGARYAVLFSYAEGGKVRNFSTEMSFNIGVLMARIHRVTENMQVNRITYNAHTLTTLPYQYANKFFQESNAEMQFIKQAGKVVEQVFANADTARIRAGVVHLDIWYDNMHINSESEMTIFDFDFCGNGWLLHDIAYFIMQIFHAEPDKKEFEAKKEAFLSGYGSINEITEEEKSLLIYSGLSIWIFYLGIQSQRFDKWSNVFLSENYLRRFIGMAKEWLRYNQMDALQ